MCPLGQSGFTTHSRGRTVGLGRKGGDDLKAVDIPINFPFLVKKPLPVV